MIVRTALVTPAQRRPVARQLREQGWTTGLIARTFAVSEMAARGYLRDA